MMKSMGLFWRVLITVAVPCLLVASCENRKEPEIRKIEVDKTELTFTKQNESKEFNVLCTDEWHADAEGIEGYFGPNMADVKDFTVSPASGKGNTTVKVTLRNEITENCEIDLRVIEKDSETVVKLKAVAAQAN